MEMVGNWAGQRRGIRLSAGKKMLGFNTGFPFHFLFHTSRWDQTNRKIVLTVMLGNSHTNDDDEDVGNVMR